MPTTTTDLSPVQEQLLEGLHQSQQTVLDGVRAWVEAAEQATLPEPPADLPQPAEVVANAFAFAEQILARQRSFAEQLVAVLPATGAVSGAHPTAAATGAVPGARPTAAATGTVPGARPTAAAADAVAAEA